VDLAGVLDTLATHAESLGYFERVLKHQPFNAPGSGLSVAFWVAPAALAPVPERSGLATTSVRATFTARMFLSADVEPKDDTETKMLAALDALLADYTGDFTAGGAATMDLLGAYGTAMDAEAGYVQFGDGWYRVVTITLPIIMDDAWTQAP
jgi:hypothetical protein